MSLVAGRDTNFLRHERGGDCGGCGGGGGSRGELDMQ